MRRETWAEYTVQGQYNRRLNQGTPLTDARNARFSAKGQDLKKLITLLLLIVVAYAGYALFWPSTFEPRAWTPPPAAQAHRPAATGDDPLARADLLAADVARGPEDVAVDAQGRIYAGYADGTIRRFDADGDNGEVFATTNGRPLGLAFAPARVLAPANDSLADGETADTATANAAATDDGTGDGVDDAGQVLIVADADKGLLAINRQGDITILADSADGTPFGFTDDVDVAANGQIYFSDASSKYGQAAYRTDLLEHGGHGRLLQYDPRTRKVTVLLAGLQFANGVAVGPDDAYVLVNETGSYRVTRYWLTGEHAGQSDVFADNLPGFPDGISFNGEDRFWVALFAPRNALLDYSADKPWLRRLVFHLPQWMQPAPKHVGQVLALDSDGRIVTHMRDAGADAFAPITSVEQVGDTLYLGSLTASAFARMPVAAPTP